VIKSIKEQRNQHNCKDCFTKQCNWEPQ